MDLTGLYNGPNNIQVHAYNQPPGGPTATSHYIANFNIIITGGQNYVIPVTWAWCINYLTMPRQADNLYVCR